MHVPIRSTQDEAVGGGSPNYRRPSIDRAACGALSAWSGCGGRPKRAPDHRLETDARARSGIRTAVASRVALHIYAKHLVERWFFPLFERGNTRAGPSRHRTVLPSSASCGSASYRIVRRFPYIRTLPLCSVAKSTARDGTAHPTDVPTEA